MKRFFIAIIFLALPNIALAGSQTYSTPGTYSFTVPAYGTLTVTVNGAGAGACSVFGVGQAVHSQPGQAGGDSSFNGTVFGYGGQPSSYWPPPTWNCYAAGAPGTASGGDSNTTGGGGSGGNASYAIYRGGSGGSASKTYSSGSLTGGAGITVIVGSGGAGGTIVGNGGSNGSPGSNGSVTITWTTPPAPTCAVTFDQNPLPYGSSTTLHYTSTNATSFYINSIGYVGSSGSTSVGPLSTTDYSGAAGNGVSTSTCPATLSVTPPSTPIATIVASSTSVYVGQSTGLHAHFSVGSGDTLTHDNIDSPVGTGWVATTNPDTDKYITFTPSSAGTYTFYARAQTQYYSSWTTYAQVSVTVTAAPACTISLSPTSIAQNGSATLSYSSSNATSFSINHMGSITPNTSGSTNVSPSISTDYTGTASAGGVNATCTAPGTSPAGTLTVSCTPAYTCSGQTIQHTDSSCNVTNVSTCVSPAFCSSGSSVCLYPAPAFTPSGNETGHLQLIPNIVLHNNSTSVYWNLSNVSGCSVTGTNGDSWTGTSSGTNGKSSKSLTQQTTYTLLCTGLDGSTVKETQSVAITPTFQEK